MSRRIHLILIAVVGLIVISVAGGIVYVDTLPARMAQHETLVYGQNKFVPASEAAMRVVVRDTRDASPLEGANIWIGLQPDGVGSRVTLYEGKTDATGTANVSFKVPDVADPAQKMIIETRSNLGSDTVERNVRIERDFRVLLTTDKPLYQPGQVIHIRALALGAFDLRPADGQEIELIIADGKGNKVFRKTIETSEYGAGWIDFELASYVNTGAYKITAQLGNTSTEKTVDVARYVLPKFEIAINTDRNFYQPGAVVAGSLDARYFFGKPVNDGQVLIEGYTFDYEKQTAFTLQGVTDADGRFAFSFQIPDYIAGSDLDRGVGRLYLQVSITDLAAHTEIKNTSLPVAASGLIVDAVPEGGQFRMGVENILYVLTSYPDGSPAETAIDVLFYENGQTVRLDTGAYGLAEVRYTPQNNYQNIRIEARDRTGAFVSREFYFDSDWQEETILLRPEKPVYRVGETMLLTILTSQPQGMVYLDIVREGQTISTRSVRVQDGRAEVAVDLSPDMYGTLQLHAYKIFTWGGISRDTRLVIVDQAADLNVTMTPDRDTFRPGEDAGVSVSVTGQDGQGAQAAIGLAIVDEAVFALAEQDPGFAKLYFMLEEELLQPKYDLHGFSIPDLVKGVPLSAEPAVQAVENAAMASLAESIPRGDIFSLKANSHEDAVRKVQERQEAFFEGLGTGLFALFILISLAILVLVLIAAWQGKLFWQSLGLMVGGVALFILAFWIWPHPWASGPLEKMGVFIEWLTYSEGWILSPLILLALYGLWKLGAHAWRTRDGSLGWTIGLLPLVFAALLGLVYAAIKADLYPPDWTLFVGLAAFVLVPVSLFLRGAMYGLQRQAALSAVSVILGLFLAFGALPLVIYAGEANTKMMAQPEFLMADGGVAVEFQRDMMLLEVEAPAATPQAVGKAEGETAASGAEPPRLRQYFPETMYWAPDLVTGPDGTMYLEFQVADSITTWRMTALASSQDGRLGSADVPLRVFQDFFIDLDLPLALTVGDEVSIPVGVFNYLEDSQSVRLVLEKAPWFELLDDEEKTIEIGANDISVVYFRVRALDFGRQPFKVTAWGSQMSDAILKEVQVYPDGKQVYFTQSDRLEADLPVSHPFFIPPDAVPGTQALLVKIYPGVLSQVVEGLDSILRMPYGCFEQTSSTTYPNVLVLDYLQTTNQAAPEAEMKAEQYINLGYQRLATFEVSGGGFSLFGNPPADRMLSAYGLQEFADMSRVYNVDPAMIERTARWILSQQNSDGSWENDEGLVHESTWSSLADARLPVTAYIAWSLADAGFGDESGTKDALAYIRENQGLAEDAYVIALVANALVAEDVALSRSASQATLAVLDRLASLAVTEGSGATWGSDVATFMGSEGRTGSIETTALAAMAFLRSETYPELANAALTALIQNKDNFGTWYSTQATVLSLKALLESVRSGAENTNATVTVTLNNGQSRTIQVTPENFDVVQMVAFDDIRIGTDNLVGITVEGEGSLMYQVSGSYYLPWDKVAIYPELVGGSELVTIDLQYDRTELTVDDTVRVDVTVQLNQIGGRADWALVDLGIPPGFSVETSDLEALVIRYQDVPEDYAYPTIERYELAGRQILVYIGNLTEEFPLSFSYHLRAKFPLRAQTPSSTAYDYYNPDVTGDARPQVIVVTP